MGFMGMGYQKWISHQKSRKPFSRNRKPIHSDGSKNHSIDDFNPHKKEKHIKLRFNLISLVWLICFATLFYFIITGWNSYVKRVNQEKQYRFTQITPERIELKIQQTLIKAIESNFKHGNFEYAKTDLELLLQKDPKNKRGREIELEISYIEAMYRPKRIPLATKTMKNYKLLFPADTATTNYISNRYPIKNPPIN